MGVIGAVMVIQQMAHQRDTTDLTLQRAVATQEEIALPPARRRQVRAKEGPCGSSQPVG